MREKTITDFIHQLKGVLGQYPGFYHFILTLSAKESVHSESSLFYTLTVTLVHDTEPTNMVVYGNTQSELVANALQRIEKECQMFDMSTCSAFSL